MAIIATNDDLTELIESILKVYFKIEVLTWNEDGTSFNGNLKGKNSNFSINYGADINAKYNFYYMGEPFHIIIKKSKKR